MKCDAEYAEGKLLELVKNNLPSKLAEIEAEKGDSITLTVPVAADYVNTTDDEVINRKFLVYYGIVGTAPDSISSRTAEELEVVFQVFMDDQNPKPGIARKKLFRYARAFQEIFEEHFDAYPFMSNPKITTIAPTSWQENENSPVYKTAGVYLSTSIG